MTYDFRIGDAIHALDQQIELEARQGYAVVDPASGSNLVTAGTGDFEVDAAAGDLRLPDQTVTASAETVDLSGVVDPDNPRKVLIYRDTNATLNFDSGVAQATAPEGAARRQAFEPAPPSGFGTDGVTLATVWIPAGATSLSDGDIRDRRIPASIDVGSLTADSGTITELDADRTRLNQFDETQTSRDWVLALDAPDTNDGLAGRSTSRQVGAAGQYFRIAGLDPDYLPIGWWAFDAGDHAVSLYTALEPKNSITQAPQKRLDVEMGSDSEQVSWSRTDSHVVQTGPSSDTLQLIGRTVDPDQDVRREYWDDSSKIWDTRLDRSIGDRFTLRNANNNAAYRVTTDLTIEWQGNPLTQLREIENPAPSDLGDREWAWDATNSRWLFKDSSGTAHFFTPDGTL